VWKETEREPWQVIYVSVGCDKGAMLWFSDDISNKAGEPPILTTCSLFLKLACHGTRLDCSFSPRSTSRHTLWTH